MRRLRRFLACLVVAATLACALTSCNTIRGAGQDVEEAGEAVQDAAD